MPNGLIHKRLNGALAGAGRLGHGWLSKANPTLDA